MGGRASSFTQENKHIRSVAARDVAQAAKNSHFMMLNEVLWSPEEDEALKQLREVCLGVGLPCISCSTLRCPL